MDNNRRDNSTFFSIQKTILDKSLIVLLFICSLAFIFTIPRIRITGFLPAHYIQLSILISILLMTLFRQKLSYKLKSITLISLLFILGINGLVSFGVTSPGIGFFTCAVVYTLLFLSNRFYLFLMTIVTAGIVLIAYLFMNRYITLQFDVLAYVESYQSWIILIISFLLFTMIVQQILSELIKKVKESLSLLSQQNHEIKNLNINLEEKITERTEELRYSNIEKDKILGVVAHDMRNKLNGVVSLLDLLQFKYDQMSDDDRLEMIKSIKGYGDNTVDVIHDLLEFSKSNFESQTIEFVKADIGNFLEECIALNFNIAAKKQIKLHYTNTSNNIYAMIHKPKFSRVIDNLLSNAIKFTAQGGNVTVYVEPHNENAAVTIIIEDSGIGIPEQLSKGIYTPFTKSGRQGTEKEQSTGLGLSIVKKIVEQHSGSIHFESKEGEGTKFFITIPTIEA